MMLSLGYLSLTLIMTLIIIAISQQTLRKTYSDRAPRRKRMFQIILGLGLWHLYTYLLTLTGILDDFSFPPRFALFLILPAFAFTILFARKNRNHAWVKNLPTNTLFIFQSFRILVESLFVWSVAKGILHKEVTIEGYNFDMVYAWLTLIIALVLLLLRKQPLKFMLGWNLVGLLVIASIIFVFLTTNYAPQLYGSLTSLWKPETTHYPYILIASYLMPLAVFVHALSIIHIQAKIKSISA